MIITIASSETNEDKYDQIAREHRERVLKRALASVNVFAIEFQKVRELLDEVSAEDVDAIATALDAAIKAGPGKTEYLKLGRSASPLRNDTVRALKKCAAAADKAATDIISAVDQVRIEKTPNPTGEPSLSA